MTAVLFCERKHGIERCWRHFEDLLDAFVLFGANQLANLSSQYWKRSIADENHLSNDVAIVKDGVKNNGDAIYVKGFDVLN